MFPSGSGSQAPDLGNGTLKMTLQVAVPMWIERVAGLTEAERQEAARECAGVIGSHGHRILYRGGKGETATVFNALARGLACAAYQPGGVTFMGLHFEAAGPGVAR